LFPVPDAEQFPDVEQLQTDWNLDAVSVANGTFLVVSAQGEGDEEALRQAAGANAAYVAFVASKAKAKKVLEYLREAGIPSERVSQIGAPAGLDIHAASPEEIAVSVLAEIIQVRGSRTKTNAELNKDTPPALSRQARDPVCGMTVDVSTANYKSEHNGGTLYFCGAGCKPSFDRHHGAGFANS
jgi:xanthine dehydrogenase accessory factor